MGRTRVVLVGGFQETKFLAKSLLSKGYKVTAINEKLDECEVLTSIERLKVIHGDGSKPFVLEDANIYGADIAIAMSPYDDANLVICQLCKKRFNVRKTAALISDPKNEEFFKSMGVDSVVCSISILSEIIEQQATFNDIKTIMPIGGGQVQVEQISVPQGAAIAGMNLEEIDLPGEAVIGCVMHGQQSIIPRGSTVIYENDLLVVIVSAESREATLKVLTGKK